MFPTKTSTVSKGATVQKRGRDLTGRDCLGKFRLQNSQFLEIWDSEKHFSRKFACIVFLCMCAYIYMCVCACVYIYECISQSTLTIYTFPLKYLGCVRNTFQNPSCDFNYCHSWRCVCTDIFLPSPLLSPQHGCYACWLLLYSSISSLCSPGQVAVALVYFI